MRKLHEKYIKDLILIIILILAISILIYSVTGLISSAKDLDWDSLIAAYWILLVSSLIIISLCVVIIKKLF